VQAIDGARAAAVSVATAGLRTDQLPIVSVRPMEELDLHSGLRLVDAVSHIVDVDGAVELRILLDDVTFIDVSGLRALFRCRDEVRSRGGAVVLMEPSSAIQRLLLVLPDLGARFEEE
jgi:anti-anti-sigma factor